MKLSNIIITSLIAVALLAFLPIFKVVVVPEWPINVVDQAGQPVGDFEVREIWHHYSFDGSGIDPAYGGEEELRSNSSGEIIFSERSFRASLFGIAFAKVGSPLRWINVHSSTGESAYFICLSGSCSYESSPHYRGNAEELSKKTLVVEHPNSDSDPEDISAPSTSGVGEGPGFGYDYPSKESD